MLTLEQKVGQKFMVGFHGLEPPDYILNWLAEGRISGVYLFSRNVESPQQVKALTQKCREAAQSEILIAIDQEGGVVARFREGFTESPGAMALGAASSVELAEKIARMLALEMQAVGINWVYAPVVDMTHNVNNPSVGVRSIGRDPVLVGEIACAQIRGFQQAGVAATAKHFPGLGNTPIDTHQALPLIDDSVEVLREHNLIAFRRVVACGVATVMPTHVKFTALDTDYPTTLSPRIVRMLLRDELGFNGVVATDCMEMKALTDHYSPTQSVVLAAQADIDLIQLSHTRKVQEEAYEGMLAATRDGRLSTEQLNQSIARIQALKAQYAICNQPSIEVIASDEHQQLAEEAAIAGAVLLKVNPAVFPLIGNTSDVGVIEFAPHQDSEALEADNATTLVNYCKPYAPQLPSISIQPLTATADELGRVYRLAETSRVLVLATRSVHLYDEPRELAQALIDRAQNVILLCLRNPYDAGVLDRAGTVLCMCGDSMPSLKAASAILFGKYEALATLPVPLK